MIDPKNNTKSHKSLSITYILLYFPHLTETFVAEEIMAVQSLGIQVQIVSLLKPRKGPVQPLSKELLKHALYAPSLLRPTLWRAHYYFLRRSKHLYFQLLLTLLRSPFSPKSIVLLTKRLVIFFKSVAVAYELKDSGIRLLHSHFAWLSAAGGMIVSQLLDLPFTITTHAFDIYSRKNDLFKLTTRAADRIVAISEYNKKVMLKLSSDLNAKQIEVIHCGIDLNSFQAADEKPTINEIFQITSVGSLVEKKGHEYLIRSCKEMEVQEIDFQCVIVGSGELRQPLQTLIQNLNLEDKVILAGAQVQPWVRDRLSKSDLFALACVVTDDGGRDGVPVAMMEALAIEVPVVSTSVSGIPELIRHEETGLLVPERDAKALAAAIARLAKDKPLRQKLARNGHTLVETEYNISKSATRLAGLFQQVIEERGK